MVIGQQTCSVGLLLLYRGRGFGPLPNCSHCNGKRKLLLRRRGGGGGGGREGGGAIGNPLPILMKPNQISW